MILTTLLASSAIAYHFKNNEYLELVKSNSEITLMNSGLTASVMDLRKQIREMPDKIVPTVRDIDMELCKGLLGVKDILNLPPTTVLDVYPRNPADKEVKKNEKPFVDIDAPLPPDLLKLLDN